VLLAFWIVLVGNPVPKFQFHEVIVDAPPTDEESIKLIA
jgi:hypothetical protein